MYAFGNYGLDRSLRPASLRAAANLAFPVAGALALRLGRRGRLQAAVPRESPGRLVPTVLAVHLVAGDLPATA